MIIMRKMIDLHTHTFLSDGELLPAELASRAEELGHKAIAITDHVGPSNLESVVKKTVRAAKNLTDSMEIDIIPGVELTHVPIDLIPKLAGEARNLGVEIVVVHGETIVEPVPVGTNIAGIKCEDVDILAHPGMLSSEEAELAEETGTYLEISARKGHSSTNGRVVEQGMEAGADLIVNTDTHSPENLITYDEAEAIALSAGLEEDMIDEVLKENPETILEESL